MVRQAEREELLAQQASALRAITARYERSHVFERRGLVAAGETLVRKRVGALHRSWPALRLALGDSFRHLAREYVLTQPRLASDSRADGRAFAQWLGNRGSLSDDAAVEVLRFDISYRITTLGVRRRRLPMVTIRRRPRLMVGLSLPRPGARLPLAGVLGRPAWSTLRTRASLRPPPVA